MAPPVSARAPARQVSLGRDDIARFAAASGDVNPLHLDPAFARETAFGQCLVHGALLSLVMAAAVPADELARIRALRLRFSGAVRSGEPVHVTAAPSARRPGAWEVHASARGKPVATALLETDPGAFARQLAPAPRSGARAPEAASRSDESPMRSIPRACGPADLEPGRMLHGAYAATRDLAALALDYGAGVLSSDLLEGLAWASYVVGMELPGRHSLFSALSLAAGPADAGPGTWQQITVRDHVPRSGHLILDGELSGPAGASVCVAAIDAFALEPAPRPAAPPASRHGPRGSGRVMVIGASRGFGAATALALAQRGFSVHGVYAQARGAAAELQAAERGHGELRLHQADAGDSEAMTAVATSLGAAAPLRGIVLSAALAPLAMGLTAAAADELAAYVADSVRLAAVPLGVWLPELDRQDGWVVFCSSAALAAPPREWPHYIAAKAALEGLAQWTATVAPTLRILVLRPPAMQTAMAATPSARMTAVSADAIAAAVALRLAAGTLAPGLTVLGPDELPHQVP